MSKKNKKERELTGTELVKEFEERVNNLYIVNKYYEENNIEMPEWLVDKTIKMGELIKQLGLDEKSCEHR